MSSTLPITPLLGPESPLDDRQRQVIERVAEAEYAKILQLPTDDPLDPKRRNRVELTRSEMLAQPEAIEATLRRNESSLPQVAERIAREPLQRAYLVGAGDSLAVMVAARALLEAALGIPCEPVQSLDFAYYSDQLVSDRSLVIALSSSGETTRTVEAALIAQHAGAVTLALTNTDGSTLSQECRDTLLIEATRRGWPTQASTAALALLQRLAMLIAEERGVAAVTALRSESDELPSLMAGVMERHDSLVEDIAHREADRSLYLFCGGGPNWASAMIGAAKVKECSPDHALAVQVEEYHHYNSQKPGEPLWLIAPNGRSVPRAVDTSRDAIRYGGQLYVVATEGQEAFDGSANELVSVPPVSEILSPMLAVVPVQMFGYHVAMAKFQNAEALRG